MNVLLCDHQRLLFPLSLHVLSIFSQLSADIITRVNVELIAL
jgi:hypothetical protein